MRILQRAATIVALALPATIHAQGTTRIESVSWLAGCLEQRSASKLVEEQRMAPLAGTLRGALPRMEFPYRRVACPTAP